MKRMITFLLGLLLIGGLLCGCSGDQNGQSDALTDVPTPTLDQATEAPEGGIVKPLRYELKVTETSSGGRVQKKGQSQTYSIGTEKALSFQGALSQPLRFSVVELTEDKLTLTVGDNAYVYEGDGVYKHETQFTLAEGETVTVALESDNAVGLYTFQIDSVSGEAS